MDAKTKKISGGVTAAKGFVAGSIFCGIKAGNKDRPDLALILSKSRAVAAGTFTTNKIKAAPVKLSMLNVRTADVRAIVANSGNANACTGVSGIETAKKMAAATGKTLGLSANQVLVCSTGRIGVPLPIEKVEDGIRGIWPKLSARGSRAAAEAIMTSDTVSKEYAVSFRAGAHTITVGGIAKGAGMIDPNMATMLSFITTDAAIAKKDLQKALSVAVDQSFNRITIDGDMSTNDTVLVLANGEAGNAPLKQGSAAFAQFQEALNLVTRNLARMIVEDGEGVTKFVEVRVMGAATYQDARKVAEAIANSTLVKCAWFGGDPNWGRIVDAAGYSTAKVREEMIDVFYDGAVAVQGGVASKTPAARIKKIVARKRFTVTVDLHLGEAEYTVYTTDLSTEYVTFNMGE